MQEIFEIPGMVGSYATFALDPGKVSRIHGIHDFTLAKPGGNIVDRHIYLGLINFYCLPSNPFVFLIVSN